MTMQDTQPCSLLALRQELQITTVKLKSITITPYISVALKNYKMFLYLFLFSPKTERERKLVKEKSRVGKSR